MLKILHFLGGHHLYKVKNQHLFVLVNFSTSRRTNRLRNLQLLSYHSNIRRQLRQVIFDTCWWYSPGMSSASFLICCLLPFMKSLLKVNKYPSKNDSLSNFSGKFAFEKNKNRAKKSVQKQSEEDMIRKYLINFSGVIIDWDIRRL